MTCPCDKFKVDLGCGDGYAHCSGPWRADGPRLAELRKWITNDMLFDGNVEIRPILHNQGVAILQLNGRSINLNEDGTWWIEATDGG